MSREPEDGLLDAYLDGALSDVERARLEARLAREPELARALATASDVRARASALLDALQLPAGRAADSDLARIRARATRSRGGGGVHRGPRFAPLAWAAALVGVIGVGLVLGRGDGAEAPTTATIPTSAAESVQLPVTTSASSAAAAAAAAPADAPAPTDAMVAATPPTRDAAPVAARRGAASAAVASAVPTASPMASPTTARAASGAPAADSTTVSIERAVATEDVSRTSASALGAADARERAPAASPAARAAAPGPATRRTAAPADAERAAAAARAVDDARAILGVAPWRLDGAELRSVARLDGAAFGGAVPTRPLLALHYRDADGREVTLLEQRALPPDVLARDWIVRDDVRVRVLGDVTRAGVDSLLARLRR
jgi:hypothetical protein